MYQPLISVVVPIYNVEKYVDRCVETIVKQSYSKLEIILVDDGSIDESHKKCDTWKEKDNRVRVVHQSNQGLSAARNAGTCVAQGEYITFVDGDDEIDADYLQTLVSLTEDGSISLTQCDFGEIHGDRKVLHGDQITSESLDSQKYLLSDDFATMAWAKLIRVELAKKYLFPMGKIHEDVAVIPQMVYEAGRVGVSQKSLYFCNLREDSINTKETYRLNHLDIIQFIKNNISFFEEKGEKEIVQKTKRQLQYELLNQYGKIINYFPERRDIRKNMLRDMRNNMRSLWRDGSIKTRTKVLLQCSAFCPKIWSRIMR